MGTLEVFNHKTKHKAVLTFKTTDMFHKDLHKVEGYIYDARYHWSFVLFYSNFDFSSYLAI